MRILFTLMIAVWALTSGPVVAAEVNYYDLLSTDRVEAKQFIKKHRSWDGRGTVIAVLDTGVDMSVAGLLKTSAGETKVVEARDFSGQGVVHLRSPSRGSEGKESIWKTGKGAVRGVDKLTPSPLAKGLLLGFVEEGKFRNSAVSDINANGKSDDRFAIVAGEIEEEGKKRWVAWVDTDADGHVDDEVMQEEFALHQKHFFFKSKAGERGDLTMAVALHFEPARKEIVLHFADGAHGTHVAGIAAGYELFGKRGFNGIAPGAQVMSLKIGDNTLSGGSTTTGSMKKAIEFAGKYSQDNKIPVIINMSYGIGTEKEGETDIDRTTDSILRRYPLLSVATSAGNSGPGLSTVGTPAGADLVFSTGALLTKANASTLYSAKIKRDVLFYFSSRGGELGKPDGLAPGCAASAVPPWENWVIMRGTSMASPQAAGCLSLVASAAVQSKEPLPVLGTLLARALRNSGQPLKDYTLADQGSGVVNVPAAWESYRSLVKRSQRDVALGFKVQGDCPSCPDGHARAAFFRAGTYLPKSPDSVSFTVYPIFATSVEGKEKDAYFETFDLTVERGDWLEPSAKSIFFQGPGSADVDVMLDVDALKKPGIYDSLIRATPRETGKGRKNGMFELWATVIVPYVFDLTNGFTRSWEKVAQEPGEVDRYFLRVPEGAASMRVILAPVDGRYTASRLTLFDPEGHEFSVSGPYANSVRNSSATALIAKEKLTPGIWEVVVMTHYIARGKSTYDLDVEFSGFHYEAPEEILYDMGSPPRSVFTIKSLFDRAFEGRGRGGIYGIYRRDEKSTKGDTIVFNVTMEKEVATVKLKLRMDNETYSRFTDCAVTVLDDDGGAVAKAGFSTHSTALEIDNPKVGVGRTTYTVQIRGGLVERSEEPWAVEVEEFYQQTLSIPAKIWCDGFSAFTLYPNRKYLCEFELQGQPTIAPSGFVYYGDIQFRNLRTGRNDLIIPLRLRVSE
jgi:tripeptidyl-peptidase II